MMAAARPKTPESCSIPSFELKRKTTIKRGWAKHRTRRLGLKREEPLLARAKRNSPVRGFKEQRREVDRTEPVLSLLEARCLALVDQTTSVEPKASREMRPSWATRPVSRIRRL